MQNTNNLCMGCMRDMGEGKDICPYCGHHDDGLQTAPYLELRTWLKDRYMVGELVSSNSEGNTYIGWDNVSQFPVYIREFMPLDVCVRANDGTTVVPKNGLEAVYDTCLQSFLELARSLARMRDLSALLPVYDIFELGGTAYYVSEYIVSITLESFLVKNGNKLNWEQTKALMMPVLGTLRSLHSADIIHRGISPETIIVGRDGKLRLIGFCIPEIRTSRGELSSELFSGYSPVEQYGFEGQVGSPSDIYAFAAVIFRMLTGMRPPESTSRVTNDLLIIPNEISEELPKYVLSALANALQILPEDRTKTVDELHSELANVSAMISKQPKNSGESAEKELSARKNNLKTVLISLGCTMVVLGLAVWLLYSNFIAEPEDSSSTPVFSVPSDESEASVVSEYVQTEVVPDLKNKTYQEATLICTNKFDLKVVGKRYSDTIAKGKIVFQTPDGNANIPVGEDGSRSTIEVYISLGKSSGTMPDVSNKTYEEAFIELVKAGFAPENITKAEKYSVSVQPQHVVDTNPIAGTKSVNYDSLVTIYVNTRTAETSSVGGEVPSIADIPLDEPSSSDESVNSSR